MDEMSPSKFPPTSQYDPTMPADGPPQDSASPTSPSMASGEGDCTGHKESSESAEPICQDCQAIDGDSGGGGTHPSNSATTTTTTNHASIIHDLTDETTLAPDKRARKTYHNVIPYETEVSLVRLVKHSDCNGTRGKISKFDYSAGFYIVESLDSDEKWLVWPEFLLQLLYVTIHGLQSKPELDGKLVVVVGIDEDSDRYHVRILETGAIVSLKPECILLNNGFVGKIVGLQAKPELNGQFGTIQAWSSEDKRYDVQLSVGQVVRVKAESIRW